MTVSTPKNDRAEFDADSTKARLAATALISLTARKIAMKDPVPGIRELLVTSGGSFCYRVYDRFRHYVTFNVYGKLCMASDSTGSLLGYAYAVT